MSRIITGVLLKSYMAVARLMGSADRRRKHIKARVHTPLAKRMKLKEA